MHRTLSSSDHLIILDSEDTDHLNFSRARRDLFNSADVIDLADEVIYAMIICTITCVLEPAHLMLFER
jgi:hypothetical protein